MVALALVAYQGSFQNWHAIRLPIPESSVYWPTFPRLSLALIPPARFGRVWILTYGPILNSGFSLEDSSRLQRFSNADGADSTIFPCFEPFLLVQFLLKNWYFQKSPIYHLGTS